MINPNTLGKFIRTKRTKLGLTQKAFSELSTVNQGRLSQVENGQNVSPTLYILEKISVALDISVIELAKMIDIKSLKVEVYIESQEKTNE